jgi:hypothetical protein
LVTASVFTTQKKSADIKASRDYVGAAIKVGRERSWSIATAAPHIATELDEGQFNILPRL